MTASQRIARLAAFALFFWAVNCADDARAQQQSIEFSLGTAGNLIVQPPRGMNKIPPPADSGASLAFGSTRKNGALLLLTPIAGADSSADAVKRAIDRGIRGARQQAVESDFPVTALRGAQASGGYFKATDRAPEADGYQYLYQGAITIGQVVIPFTILFNDGSERLAKDALESVSGMRVQAKNGK